MSTGVARRRATIVSSDSEEDSSDFSQARYPSLADSGSRQPLKEKGTRNTNYSFGRHHHHSSSSKHSPSDSILSTRVRFFISLSFFILLILLVAFGVYYLGGPSQAWTDSKDFVKFPEVTTPVDPLEVLTKGVVSVATQIASGAVSVGTQIATGAVSVATQAVGGITSVGGDIKNVGENVGNGIKGIFGH
ncbi:hypothetical protein JCM5350_007628 [Sporobolomyces pararoseus]